MKKYFCDKCKLEIKKPSHQDLKNDFMLCKPCDKKVMDFIFKSLHTNETTSKPKLNINYFVMSLIFLGITIIMIGVILSLR